jgi:CIC family chloride channel protein
VKPSIAASHFTARLRRALEIARARWNAARLPRTLPRLTLPISEENLFLLLAVIIGLSAGLTIVLFRIAIEWSRLWLLGSALSPPAWRTLLAPTLTGLVIAFLVVRFFPRVRGSGVNQTKSAVFIYDGYIPFNTVTGKFLTSALSIGSGQSLGPEDPSLQMGAGIASALGRRMRLSREKLRLIAPVGAAAGLAAAFNAPITAVLFVIEEVIGRWSAGVLGAIVLSAVSSVVVERWFLGAEPLFRVPVYRLEDPSELLAYALLGIIGGLCSLLFLKLVRTLRPRLMALPRWTQYVQPAGAGLAVGIIGLGVPQVMGAGYEFIDQAMHDQYAWRMLLLMGAFKILATGISFSCGAPGGLFAPTLFMGAMLGGAVGSLEHAFLPGFAGPVGAYALVGMGAMFAGVLRAPITSVFMILEVSGNYAMILPLMITNTIAYLVSRHYQRTPLFDMLARQERLDLPSIEEQREEAPLHVEDAMQRPAGRVISSELTVHEALDALGETAEEYVLAGQGPGRWSLVSLDTLRRLAEQGSLDLPLRGLVSEAPVPTVYPDQPLVSALRHLSDWPVLPVVHRVETHRLEGIITLADVLNVLRNAPVPTAALRD